jgi:hypothetical protein
LDFLFLVLVAFFPFSQILGIIGYSLSVMGEYITSRQEKILTEALSMNDMPILINEEDEDTENSDVTATTTTTSDSLTSITSSASTVTASSQQLGTHVLNPNNNPSLFARCFARVWKWRKVIYSILGVMMVIIVGSLFSVLHMGMDVPTAFYFSIVTSTTGTVCVFSFVCSFFLSFFFSLFLFSLFLFLLFLFIYLLFFYFYFLFFIYFYLFLDVSSLL